MTTTKAKLIDLLRQAAQDLREYRRDDQLESQGFQATAENTADSLAVEIEAVIAGESHNHEFIHARLNIDGECGELFEVFAETREAALAQLQIAVMYWYRYASNTEQLWEQWRKSVVYRELTFDTIYRENIYANNQS